MSDLANGAYRYSWLRCRVIPILVWFLAITGIVALYRQKNHGLRVSGVVRARIQHLAPVYDGRIASVSVRLFQTVKKGDVIVRLDDTPLRAQITSLAAERERLRAEFEENQSVLDADVKSRHSEWVAERRAFSSDASQLGILLQQTRTTVETDKHTLDGLKISLENQRVLLKAGAVSISTIDASQALHDSMCAKIKENEKLIAQLEAERIAASKRFDEYTPELPVYPSVEKAREQMEQAMRVQDGLIKQLEAQCAQYVLRAPFNGVIVDVRRNTNDEETFRPGEGICRGVGDSVVAGEPIFAIAETEPSEIVAYAAETVAGELLPGQAVELRSARPQSAARHSRVVAVAPTVERLPQRLWLNPTTPAWGRPFLIAVPEGFEAGPGELVTVTRK